MKWRRKFSGGRRKVQLNEDLSLSFEIVQNCISFNAFFFNYLILIWFLKSDIFWTQFFISSFLSAIAFTTHVGGRRKYSSRVPNKNFISLRRNLFGKSLWNLARNFSFPSKGLRGWFEEANSKENEKKFTSMPKRVEFNDNFFIFVMSREKIMKGPQVKLSESGKKRIRQKDELRRCHGNEEIFLRIVIKTKESKFAFQREFRKKTLETNGGKWIRKHSGEPRSIREIINFKQVPVSGFVLDRSAILQHGPRSELINETVLIHIET